ncbi:hypothetical protein Bca101_016551 [Brassica carinata]
MIPNPAVSVENNGDSKLSTSNGDRRVLDYENEFWKQPDGLGSSHALISAMSTGERDPRCCSFRSSIASQPHLGRLEGWSSAFKEFDSRLSRDLPSDLQKLSCKVAFEALKFSPRVMEMGMKLAERMRSKGPYIVLHLWLEKDVWVRTGCLTGLSSKYDEIARIKGIKRPELLTAKSNKLLRALGALRDSRIYWAGREPLGGKEALKPLTSEFPHL